MALLTKCPATDNAFHLLDLIVTADIDPFRLIMVVP